jgi:hypothetical protein
VGFYAHMLSMTSHLFWGYVALQCSRNIALGLRAIGEGLVLSKKEQK